MGIGSALVKATEGAIANTAKNAVAKTTNNALSRLVGNEVIKATGKSVLGGLIPTATASVVSKSVNPVSANGMKTLYRGLSQKYDPNYPIAKLDTSGYESWTDNYDLAKQYGDNVYSIDVPESDIKTSYLDEDPMSETYGDRNPIYSIDKKAGLNGVSGKEYLLEVGSDYQKGLKYNPVGDAKQRIGNYIPVQYKESSPKNIQLRRLSDALSDEDADMLMENLEANIGHKMAGDDTTADEIVLRNILKKNGVSDGTFSKLKDYSTIGSESGVYDKAKSYLNRVLPKNNKEIKRLNDMSRRLINRMSIERENGMPVVYRAVPHRGNGEGLSYTFDRNIAESLVKNDGGTYKEVVRYVVRPNDVVIAPQILGPMDTGADLQHIVVKKMRK